MFNKKLVSELLTVLPDPVGIAETTDPPATPVTQAVVVSEKFRTLDAPTRIPDSKVVNVAEPTWIDGNPVKIHRPAVAAGVPSHASEVAALRCMPSPVGVTSPCKFVCVSMKFCATFEK